MGLGSFLARYQSWRRARVVRALDDIWHAGFKAGFVLGKRACAFHHADEIQRRVEHELARKTSLQIGEL